MKNIISIAAVLALASGLILGSSGTLIPVHAQTNETNATAGNATAGNATGGNATGGGGPLSDVPIIGDILGGGQ
jgi:hypothetical protein